MVLFLTHVNYSLTLHLKKIKIKIKIKDINIHHEVIEILGIKEEFFFFFFFYGKFGRDFIPLRKMYNRGRKPAITIDHH